MKITDVAVKRYGQQSRDGTPTGGEIQTVMVETDEGISGLGFVTANSPTADFVASLIRQKLRDIVLGEDPLLTDSLWQRMHEQVVGQRGARGFVLQSIAAIDFACWDIKAKRLGRPVGDLFGRRRLHIPTYVNAGHVLAPADVANTAADYVAKGHTALKIRGGLNTGTTQEATARVQAAREAIGPDIKLMVDVNGTWDADIAIQQLRAWEPYDLYWLEEPCPPDDIPGYIKVRQRSGNVHIAGGEKHSGMIEFRSLLENKAVDILQPAASRVGGITEWLRVYDLATAYGVPVSPWNVQCVHIHMAAGLSNVKWIEYFMPDNQMLEFQNRLFKEPLYREETTSEGVFLLPPDQPGLGIVVDELAAERHLIQEPFS